MRILVATDFCHILNIYALILFLFENDQVINFLVALAHLYTYIEINSMIYNGSLFSWRFFFLLIFVSYGKISPTNFNSQNFCSPFIK